MTFRERAKKSFTRNKVGPRLSERNGWLAVYDIATAGEPKKKTSTGLVIGGVCGMLLIAHTIREL